MSSELPANQQRHPNIQQQLSTDTAFQQTPQNMKTGGSRLEDITDQQIEQYLLHKASMMQTQAQQLAVNTKINNNQLHLNTNSSPSQILLQSSGMNPKYMNNEQTSPLMANLKISPNSNVNGANNDQAPDQSLFHLQQYTDQQLAMINAGIEPSQQKQNTVEYLRLQKPENQDSSQQPFKRQNQAVISSSGEQQEAKQPECAGTQNGKKQAFLKKYGSSMETYKLPLGTSNNFYDDNAEGRFSELSRQDGGSRMNQAVYQVMSPAQPFQSQTLNHLPTTVIGSNQEGFYELSQQVTFPNNQYLHQNQLNVGTPQMMDDKTPTPQRQQQKMDLLGLALNGAASMHSGGAPGGEYQQSDGSVNGGAQVNGGQDIIQIMKDHLRQKYTKYQTYSDHELETRILRFLQDYLSEIKAKDGGCTPQPMTQQQMQQQQMMQLSDDEYGSLLSVRKSLDSTLDWGNQAQIEKRIFRQQQITKALARDETPQSTPNHGKSCIEALQSYRSLTEYFGGIKVDILDEEQMPHTKLIELFRDCFGQVYQRNDNEYGQEIEDVQQNQQQFSSSSQQKQSQAIQIIDQQQQYSQQYQNNEPVNLQISLEKDELDDEEDYQDVQVQIDHDEGGEFTERTASFRKQKVMVEKQPTQGTQGLEGSRQPRPINNGQMPKSGVQSLTQSQSHVVIPRLRDIKCPRPSREGPSNVANVKIFDDDALATPVAQIGLFSQGSYNGQKNFANNHNIIKPMATEKIIINDQAQGASQATPLHTQNFHNAKTITNQNEQLNRNESLTKIKHLEGPSTTTLPLLDPQESLFTPKASSVRVDTTNNPSMSEVSSPNNPLAGYQTSMMLNEIKKEQPNQESSQSWINAPMLIMPPSFPPALISQDQPPASISGGIASLSKVASNVNLAQSGIKKMHLLKNKVLGSGQKHNSAMNYDAPQTQQTIITVDNSVLSMSGSATGKNSTKQGQTQSISSSFVPVKLRLKNMRLNNDSESHFASQDGSTPHLGQLPPSIRGGLTTTSKSPNSTSLRTPAENTGETQKIAIPTVSQSVQHIYHIQNFQMPLNVSQNIITDHGSTTLMQNPSIQASFMQPSASHVVIPDTKTFKRQKLNVINQIFAMRALNNTVIQKEQQQTNQHHPHTSIQATLNKKRMQALKNIYSNNSVSPQKIKKAPHKMHGHGAMTSVDQSLVHPIQRHNNPSVQDMTDTTNQEDVKSSSDNYQITYQPKQLKVYEWNNSNHLGGFESRNNNDQQIHFFSNPNNPNSFQIVFPSAAAAANTLQQPGTNFGSFLSANSNNNKSMMDSLDILGYQGTQPLKGIGRSFLEPSQRSNATTNIKMTKHQKSKSQVPMWPIPMPVPLHNSNQQYGGQSSLVKVPITLGSNQEKKRMIVRLKNPLRSILGTEQSSKSRSPYRYQTQGEDSAAKSNKKARALLESMQEEYQKRSISHTESQIGLSSSQPYLPTNNLLKNNPQTLASAYQQPYSMSNLHDIRTSVAVLDQTATQKKNVIGVPTGSAAYAKKQRKGLLSSSQKPLKSVADVATLLLNDSMQHKLALLRNKQHLTQAQSAASPLHQIPPYKNPKKILPPKTTLTNDMLDNDGHIVYYNPINSVAQNNGYQPVSQNDDDVSQVQSGRQKNDMEMPYGITKPPSSKVMRMLRQNQIRNQGIEDLHHQPNNDQERAMSPSQNITLSGWVQQNDLSQCEEGGAKCKDKKTIKVSKSRKDSRRVLGSSQGSELPNSHAFIAVSSPANSNKIYSSVISSAPRTATFHRKSISHQNIMLIAEPASLPPTTSHTNLLSSNNEKKKAPIPGSNTVAQNSARKNEPTLLPFQQYKLQSVKKKPPVPVVFTVNCSNSNSQQMLFK